MKLTESIRISWRAITGHKLRSTLTTLGIIIGIGAVIGGVGAIPRRLRRGYAPSLRETVHRSIATPEFPTVTFK